MFFLNKNSDEENFVYFNDVLFASLRKAYDSLINDSNTKAAIEFVKNEEAKTMRIIQDVKRKV